MQDELKYDYFKKMIERVSETINDNSSYLSELDSEIGDGDHGTTISKGFKAVEKQLQADPQNNIAGLLNTVGTTLMKIMGGVSGPIFGSIFIAMSREAKGKESIDLEGFRDMLAGALEKVKKLGGADVGDKTLVDSLDPAVRSLEHSSSGGLSIKEALELAEKASLKGTESTKDMVAKKGRSRHVGERSLGFQDAGATTMYLIIRSMKESLP